MQPVQREVFVWCEFYRPRHPVCRLFSTFTYYYHYLVSWWLINDMSVTVQFIGCIVFQELSAPFSRLSNSSSFAVGFPLQPCGYSNLIHFHQMNNCPHNSLGKLIAFGSGAQYFTPYLRAFTATVNKLITPSITTS